MSKITHPTRVILSGRSTLGKTTLAVDIICLQLMHSVRRCFAVCPTFWRQNALLPLRAIPGAFHKKNVFTQNIPQAFDRIYNTLVREKTSIPTLLFVDDVAGDYSTNMGNKGTFAKLCTESPHFNLSIVGCFQQLIQAAPPFRHNAECLISFAPTRTSCVRIIKDEFNPCPADPLSEKKVRDALNHIWDNGNYCFLFKEKRSKTVSYYREFEARVTV